MFDKYKVELTLVRDMLATNPSDPHVHDTHILERQRQLILEKKGVNSEINKYLSQLEIDKEKSDAEKELLLDKLEAIIGTPFTEEERQAAVRGELESLKETFRELDIKGVTVFFWDKAANRPCIGDHMVYGFLKAAAEAIGRTLPQKRGEVLHSISYTQSLINQHVRCCEKFITFDRDIKRDEQGNPLYLQRSLRAMTAKGPRISLAKSEIVEAGAKLCFHLKVLKNSALTEETLRTLFGYGEFVGLGQWRSSGAGMYSFEMNKV
jgi:hypothetical protein